MCEADRFSSAVLRMLQDGKHYTKQMSLGKYEYQNQSHECQGKYFLLDHSLLHHDILQDYHDTPESHNCVQGKTFEIVDEQLL
jgi:hypothetical protein